MNAWIRTRLCAAAGAAVLLASCAETPPPRLYVLNAASVKQMQPVPAAAANSRTLVGVAPVTMPDYVDRPEIVMRNTNNEVTATAGSRWAESLSTNATSVLVENLATLLGSDRVVPMPARSAVGYEVALDLRRFELDSDWNAVMVGRWAVIDMKTNKEIASGALRQSEPVGQHDDYNELAAAMSRNLATASSAIAGGVSQPRSPGKKTQRAAMAGAN